MNEILLKQPKRLNSCKTDRMSIHSAISPSITKTPKQHKINISIEPKPSQLCTHTITHTITHNNHIIAHNIILPNHHMEHHTQHHHMILNTASHTHHHPYSQAFEWLLSFSACFCYRQVKAAFFTLMAMTILCLLKPMLTTLSQEVSWTGKHQGSICFR